MHGAMDKKWAAKGKSLRGPVFYRAAWKSEAEADRQGPAEGPIIVFADAVVKA